jgi:hypothetical protein
MTNTNVKSGTANSQISNTFDVSPSSIIFLDNSCIQSTVLRKTPEELADPSILDKLNCLFGMSTNRYEESIDDFFNHLKSDEENIRSVNIMGKARAYDLFIPSPEQIYFAPLFPSSDFPSPTMVAPNFPAVTLDKTRMQYKIRGPKHGRNEFFFVENMKIVQEDIVNINRWLQLHYSEKKEAKMSEFTISPASKLRVKEASWPDKYEPSLACAEQTAILGFSVISKTRENHVLTEEYQIRIFVKKTINYHLQNI